MRAMAKETAAIYAGTVSHTRMRPVGHRLSYRVFSLLLDCDRLDDLARSTRLFSHNRFNLVSLHDRDHGSGDGTPLTTYLRHLAEGTPHGRDVVRFKMLCYPRVLGYGFNPLTVYYGLDASDRIRLMVYEVNNTFGQRKTYVLPVSEGEDQEIISQKCAKELYVSPFNTVAGTYSFHLTKPDETLTLGVALKDEEGPLLKAHFRGARHPFGDAGLLRQLARTGWMSLKVIGGIHFEAARLWLKGMRLKPRPAAPSSAITYVEKAGDQHA